MTIVCGVLSPVLSADNPALVDFKRDIKPIFEERCFECHDARKQKSGFRLDRRTDAFRGGDSTKTAIVPGKPEESSLFQKITAKSDQDLMPQKGGRLPEEQIAAIRSWIEQGASWPEDSSEKPHWAYVKPERPTVPERHGSVHAKNTIDLFVFDKLHKEGLKPSPPAPRPSSLRKLSLDLVGLPPTIDELNRFGADESEESWERAVDYYLNSPHYGEQRARLWLDLARYADSQGYEQDPGRQIWLYRDWVIDAFNQNMPFDQFTLEQIAGDMLPKATRTQKIASGFHRNTMFNAEGGVDREEARVETIVDRVNTTATVWLGTTLACAQCHTHKYDPFTLKEYYQFYAFFNNVDEPEMEVPSPDQEEKRAALNEDAKPLQAQLDTQTPELNNTQAIWEYKVAQETPKWTALEPVGFVSAGGATLQKLDDQSLLASGANPKNDSYTVVVHTDATRITGLRLDVLPDDSLPKKSLGRHKNGSFVLSRFEVKVAPKDDPKGATSVTLKRAAADYTQDGHSATNLIDGKGPGWAASAGDEKMRVQRYVLFEPEKPIELEGGATLTFTLRNDSKFTEANVGRFRLSFTTNDTVIPEYLVPVATYNLLAIAPVSRSDEQKKQLSAYYRSVAPELKSTRDELAANRKALDALQKEIPKTLVMQERAKDPRETRIHVRGNFMNKGDQVAAGVPAVLNPLPAGETNRIALAKWLASRDNPLTARVMVNRFWAQLFGRGIVETEEDFGTQGAVPTHPELLDWLALEFMESGWDIKHLHKLIVMSATYRQNSHATPALLERDPDNRLLARGARFRVPAESVRDIALVASGLLQPEIGGPSVYPYQPDGIWTQIYGNAKWVLSKGANKYRRGLYTYWKRTSPYPAFMSFDAPSREYCTARRPRTNTPLQALTTLNDPFYVEAAQALALKIMKTEGSLSKKIDFAFRASISRSPRDQERERLAQLFQRELQHYTEDQKAATDMAFGPDQKGPEGCNAAEAAAWTVVANIMLNLDETITKG